MKYSSLIINSSSYVYLINSFDNEKNLYFSFSFESNKTNLDKYNIFIYFPFIYHNIKILFKIYFYNYRFHKIMNYYYFKFQINLIL